MIGLPAGVGNPPYAGSTIPGGSAPVDGLAEAYVHLLVAKLAYLGVVVVGLVLQDH